MPDTTTTFADEVEAAVGALQKVRVHLERLAATEKRLRGSGYPVVIAIQDLRGIQQHVRGTGVE